MGADFDKGEGNQSPGGMGLIAPHQGLAALERLLSQNLAQVAVMPVNWAQWQKVYPAFSKSRLLSQLVRPEIDGASSGSTGFRLTVEKLLALAPEERLEAVEGYLGEQVAHIIKLPATAVDIHEPLTNLGLDSLMALELKNRIETDLEAVIPMVQFLEGPALLNYPYQFGKKSPRRRSRPLLAEPLSNLMVDQTVIN
jgi:acyl carrier protein